MTRDAVTARKRFLGAWPRAGSREASPAGVGGSRSRLGVGTPPQPWGPMGCVLCHAGQRHEWGWHVSSYLQRGARGPGLVLLGGDAEL